MIMGSVGKIYSFKVSPKLLIVASLFCLIFICASLFVINDYMTIDEKFGFHRVTSVQSERIKSLEREVMRRDAQLSRAKRNLAFFEDYIKNLEDQQRETGTAEADTSKEVKASTKAEDRPRKREQKVEVEKVVDLKDVVIQKQGSQITVAFKLVNLLSGDDAVGGYIHIIARNSKSDPPGEWSYPTEKIVHGMPANYRRGLLFLIQRFKPIKGTINLVSSSEIPSSIVVLVYDQSGEIILEKEFEVSHAS